MKKLICLIKGHDWNGIYCETGRKLVFSKPKKWICWRCGKVEINKQ